MKKNCFFFKLLELAGMHNQQNLLNITCSIKSKPRLITLTRSNRTHELSFSVLGGRSVNSSCSGSSGIFISNVEPYSIAEKNGLKRGDEVNFNFFLLIYLKYFRY